MTCHGPLEKSFFCRSVVVFESFSSHFGLGKWECPFPFSFSKPNSQAFKGLEFHFGRSRVPFRKDSGGSWAWGFGFSIQIPIPKPNPNLKIPISRSQSHNPKLNLGPRSQSQDPISRPNLKTQSQDPRTK